VGGIPKIRTRGNVFNGGATTGGHMDKWRLRVDSARQICLGSYRPGSSDCSVDVRRGGEICWAEFRKSESGRMFSMAER